MEISSEIVKSPQQRFATLIRSPVFLIGILAAVTGLWSAFVINLNSQPSTPVREQLQYADAVLVETGKTLKYVQSVEGKLNFFLDEVARRSERLPDPNDRATLAQETQAYKSLMDVVNAKLLTAIYDINSYETTTPRQHRSTSILSIAALAQIPPAAFPISSIDSLRPMIMFFVLVAITLFFFICVVLFCFTADADKLKFADNMMRTIVGFYIGIVTGLLGLPGLPGK